MSWQVTLVIRDPSEEIARYIYKSIRDEWLGPEKSDLPGSPGVTVDIREVEEP